MTGNKKADILKRVDKDNYLLTEVANTDIDSSSLCKYVDKYWARQVSLSLVDFFDWQFRYYPGGNGVNRSLVIINRKTNDIGGFFGITPRRFTLNGNIIRGAEITTWMVSEELRGMSFASDMLNHLINSYDFICAVGGMSDAALDVYKRNGFKHIRWLPRFYKIYNLEHTQAISNITNLGFKLLSKLNIGVKTIPDVEEFNSTSNYKNFYENLNCFSRSFADIEWRYINHPYFKYQIFVVNPNGEKEVFLILRVEEHESICLCHVIDFYGYEEGFMDALDFIDYYCVNNGMDFADFYCLSSRITKYFWCNGWLSVLDDFQVTVPHLFNPIELKNPPTACVIMYSAQYLTQLCDINRLYITKGDGDLDKPTISYLQENNLI